MRGKTTDRKKYLSNSDRANLHFPVGRIARYLRVGHFAPNISLQAAVALAAILENIIFEILDLTTKIVKNHKV